MPSGQQPRFRTLQVHNHPGGAGYAGRRVAVNLAGLRRDAVVRGDTLCKPGTPAPVPDADVRLTDLKDSHRIIENGSRYTSTTGLPPTSPGGAAGAGYAGAGSVRLCPAALYGAGGGEAGDRLLSGSTPHGDHRRRHHSDDCPPRHKRHQPEVIGP